MQQAPPPYVNESIYIYPGYGSSYEISVKVFRSINNGIKIFNFSPLLFKIF